MNRNLNPIPNRLQILQLNLNKSQKAHLDLINGALQVGKWWDIILIQEPYITYLGHIQTPNCFVSISPQARLTKPEDTVRLVIWVNSGLSSNSWKVLNISGNNDLTVVQIKTGNTTILIINIYNDCTHSLTLTRLRRYMQTE